MSKCFNCISAVIMSYSACSDSSKRKIIDRKMHNCVIYTPSSKRNIIHHFINSFFITPKEI